MTVTTIGARKNSGAAQPRQHDEDGNVLWVQNNRHAITVSWEIACYTKEWVNSDTVHDENFYAPRKLTTR